MAAIILFDECHVICIHLNDIMSFNREYLEYKICSQQVAVLCIDEWQLDRASMLIYSGMQVHDVILHVLIVMQNYSEIFDDV